jgi:hypothetical protein
MISLFTAVYFTSGQVPRSTELNGLTYVNLGRQRNLYEFDSYLVMLFEYSKTSWIDDLERKTIRIMLPELMEIVKPYLLYLRPLEIGLMAASEICNPKQISDASRLVFSSFGLEINVDRFNAYLRKKSQQYIESEDGVTMSFMRHVVVHIGREYLQEEKPLQRCIQRLLDSQAGHTSSVALDHYAIPAAVTPGDPRYYSAYKETSLAHHRFYGFGVAESGKRRKSLV